MIAISGLCIPNGIFVYYLVTEFSQWRDIFQNHLALAFIIDAFMKTTSDMIIMISMINRMGYSTGITDE